LKLPEFLFGEKLNIAYFLITFFGDFYPHFDFSNPDFTSGSMPKGQDTRKSSTKQMRYHFDE
jgi:hypothetical protein